MPTKSIEEKGYKIMLNGSNCDRNSQLSEILTEPLNPPGMCPIPKGTLNIFLQPRISYPYFYIFIMSN